jgi:hypothetical protein
MTATPEFKYTRAAFIAYEPNGYTAKPQRKRVIPFRFNPESLSRTVAVEAAKPASGVAGAAQKAPAGNAGDTKADPGSGTLKESFSIRIRLDFDDRGEAAAGLDQKLGIAPEIAAIEELLYPVATDADKTKGKKGAQAAAPARPTVLLVWGRERMLPVRIASLKIEESVYNADLYPVRAEIEASLEVLGATEAAAHTGVQAALDHTNQARRRLAKQYYDNTGSTGPTPQN